MSIEVSSVTDLWAFLSAQESMEQKELISFPPLFSSSLFMSGKQQIHCLLSLNLFEWMLVERRCIVLSLQGSR